VRVKPSQAPRWFYAWLGGVRHRIGARNAEHAAQIIRLAGHPYSGKPKRLADEQAPVEFGAIQPIDSTQPDILL
jgi:hypothetical protein